MSETNQENVAMVEDLTVRAETERISARVLTGPVNSAMVVK